MEFFYQLVTILCANSIVSGTVINPPQRLGLSMSDHIWDESIARVILSSSLRSDERRKKIFHDRDGQRRGTKVRLPLVQVQQIKFRS